MAIRIDTDKAVRVINPYAKSFNLEDLNKIVDGFIEPLKLGPVWIMYDEKAKENGAALNEIASFFFNVALYGTVLIVPPQQLPLDWDLMEDSDRKYSAEDIDAGFLLSLQTALIQQRVFGGLTDMENLMDKFPSGQEEWFYSPPVEDTLDESTQDFYRQVYDYITMNPDKFKKDILLEDRNTLVRVRNIEERKKVINQMIDYFVQEEEYEKCALLKNVL